MRQMACSAVRDLSLIHECDSDVFVGALKLSGKARLFIGNSFEFEIVMRRTAGRGMRQSAVCGAICLKAVLAYEHRKYDGTG